MGLHKTIVYVPPRTDGTLSRMVDAWSEPRFFTVSVLTAHRSTNLEVLDRQRFSTVCFCGTRISRQRCEVCGYATPAYRQHVTERDPERERWAERWRSVYDFGIPTTLDIDREP